MGEREEEKMRVDYLLEHMNKGNSLLFLRYHCLNTSSFTIIRDYIDFESWMDSWQYGRISVRSYKEKGLSFNELFRPNVILDRSLMEEIFKCLDNGYSVIVSKGVDPEGTLFKGNIQLSRELFSINYLIEYTEGYGTVRDLETAKKIYRVSNNTHNKINMLPAILGLLRKSIELYSNYFYKYKVSIILEWSIYEFPVGALEDELIFWEIRRGGSE